MSKVIYTKEYSKYILLVTENGFYLYSKEEEGNFVVDASRLETSDGWAVQISCKPSKVPFYSEANLAETQDYFHAGLWNSNNKNEEMAE